ncbi:MAG TPA: A24 family peptidase [Jiangellales bacterium]|nr:A24 family peptidase [Jiangellales bacterium]
MTAAVCGVLGLLVGTLLLPGLVARLPDRVVAEGEPPPVPYRSVVSDAWVRPVLALATAGVWAVLGAARSGRPDLPAFLALGAFGVALALVDLRTRRLPDLLTGPALAAGAVLLLAAAVADGGWGAYGRAWVGAVLLFGGYLLLAVVRPSDMGLGDVKLAAPLGLHLAWLGWGQLVLGAFLGFLVGGVAGLVLIALRRVTRRSSLPFGPSMLVGALLAVVWGEPVVDAYLGR